MATEKTHRWDPDYLVHPGVILRDTIEALDLSQVDLARRTDLSPKHVNQILQGAASITPETALALERVTRVPARFWNALEANFQSREAQLRERKELGTRPGWLERFPLNDMKQRDLIPKSSNKADLFEAVLRFFGVASPEAWESVWLQENASFRKSRAFQSDPYAVATWLRIGELDAAKVKCDTYDRLKFLAALKRIRKLTADDPGVFGPKLEELCQKAGVAVVVVPEIPKARVSGAARWLSPDKALIQLSLRGRWEDLFWFSFFHEAGHILRHSKKMTFIEPTEGRKSAEEKRLQKSDSEEAEADVFAANFLILPEYQDELFTLSSEEDIRAFASLVGVSAAIVLGRLKHEGVIAWNKMNDLRRRYVIAEN